MLVGMTQPSSSSIRVTTGSGAVYLLDRETQQMVRPPSPGGDRWPEDGYAVPCKILVAEVGKCLELLKRFRGEDPDFMLSASIGVVSIEPVPDEDPWHWKPREPTSHAQP
ncbi:hypothetical protein GCM10009628_29850 [Paeniglutamicibacter kerguelensis]